MFGYIRPVREDLDHVALAQYDAVYCGLCHAIGTRHGLVARMFLSYDFVLLAMLCSTEQTKPIIQEFRCPARFMCRKKPCAQSNGLDIAADQSIILSYWKLRDTIMDGTRLQRIGAHILSLLLYPSYRRASKSEPLFDQNVILCLSELRNLELANTSSLDHPADAFAKILQSAFYNTENTSQERAMSQLLYHVGRWIYLVDAWDDLQEDRCRGSYNPILARFDVISEDTAQYLRTTLQHSRGLATSAYELLELGCWRGLVGNILYRGLPAVEELVFQGIWRQRKRTFHKQKQK